MTDDQLSGGHRVFRGRRRSAQSAENETAGRWELLAAGLFPPPVDVALHLRLDALNDHVLTEEYLYIADDSTRNLVTAYILYPTRVGRADGGSNQRARTCLREFAVARLPSSAECTTLKVPVGQPVLDVLRVGLCTATRVVFPGDTQSVTYDILGVDS